MPATQCCVLTLVFGVLNNREVFEQQLCNRITRFAAILLNYVDTAAPVWLFICDVMAEQSAEFQIMVAHHLGEVVLPGEQVLMILPRRLVPEIAYTTCAPTDGWIPRSCDPREDGGEYR